LEEELSTEREQAEKVRAESDRAAKHSSEADQAVAAAQAQSQEREQARAVAEERMTELQAELTELQAELTDARAELQEQQGTDERIAAALAERDEALANMSRLEEELSRQREQTEMLRAESDRAAQPTSEADRAGEALGEQLDPEALEPGPPAPASNGLKWDADSRLALAGALEGLTDWRAVLKRAVGVLGSEGGWDAAIAVTPDGPRRSMRCCGIWTRDPARLATFETRSWHHLPDASTGEFARARTRMATTCLLELHSAEDPLIAAAAAEGMASALLVPIARGGELIAMLALFSRTDRTPTGELMASVEEIAGQLGEIAQLKPPEPRWLSARM
jgi:hypothetical protein